MSAAVLKMVARVSAEERDEDVLPRPHLRLLQVPAKKPKNFRQPRKELREKFFINVSAIFDYAVASGQRAVFFTLTSRMDGSGGEIVDDLKKCWAKLQDRAVFRSLPAAFWVVGDHGRPAIHLLAVLPAGVSIRSMRLAWLGGFSQAKTADGNAEKLADYLAAQFRPFRRTFLRNQRSFGFRAPPQQHLDSGSPSQPCLLPVAAPQAQPQGVPLRAGTGGLAESADAACRALQARPCTTSLGCGVAPPGAGAAGAMHAASADKARPPCGSEQRLRLVPPPLHPGEQGKSLLHDSKTPLALVFSITSARPTGSSSLTSTTARTLSS